MQQERTSAWQPVAAALLACALVATACSRGPAAPAADQDVLVLEVGGQHASLRASLQALGRPVADSGRFAQQPVAVPNSSELDPDPAAQGRMDERETQAYPGTQADPGGQQPPNEPPGQEPALDQEWVTVPLTDGETLIHVARRHLGDGRRFAEVLRWNGWSEAEARRLPVGQAIRLKRTELR